jgi:hypothetical protein
VSWENLSTLKLSITDAQASGTFTLVPDAVNEEWAFAPTSGMGRNVPVLSSAGRSLLKRAQYDSSLIGLQRDCTL